MATIGKPGPVTNHAGGGSLSTSGTLFYIKVRESQEQFFSPAAEVTGDDDSYPEFENNGLLYGNITVRGLMIASQAIGLNEIQGSNNPVSLELDLSTNRKLVLTALVEAVAINWSRTAQYIGVTMSIRMTGTNPANLEQTV